MRLFHVQKRSLVQLSKKAEKDPDVKKSREWDQSLKEFQTPYKTWSKLFDEDLGPVFKFFWSEGNPDEKSHEKKFKEMHTKLTKGSIVTAEFSEKAIELLCKLDALERVYRFLLGDKIRYHTGDQGPELDLLFLCVLMNCKELAFELWKQCSFPVRAAICAVRLLHMCPPSAHAHNQ